MMQLSNSQKNVVNKRIQKYHASTIAVYKNIITKFKAFQLDLQILFINTSNQDKLPFKVLYSDFEKNQHSNTIKNQIGIITKLQSLENESDK